MKKKRHPKPESYIIEVNAPGPDARIGRVFGAESGRSPRSLADVCRAVQDGYHKGYSDGASVRDIEVERLLKVGREEGHAKLVAFIRATADGMRVTARVGLSRPPTSSPLALLTNSLYGKQGVARPATEEEARQRQLEVLADHAARISLSSELQFKAQLLDRLVELIASHRW